MFLPTTKDEMKELGWAAADIIIVTGDSYIDSPYIGAAQIGKYLLSKGFKTAIIAQPDINSGEDILRLGEPLLYWGVTGGSVDSMVANYTASGKKRNQDDFTPGVENNKRPDRAVIAYSNLIRRFFKNTRPIVLGGIEASLRRVAHYDFWSNSIRRSVLFDAKADYLVYGMAEKSLLEFSQKLKNNEEPRKTNGVSWICPEKDIEDFRDDFIELPSYEEVSKKTDDGKIAFIRMFEKFYSNTDFLTAKGLVQKTGDRFLVQNPPGPPPTAEEVDSYYDLSFTREHHPYYEKKGKVRALDTIRFSVTTHRGCYGECNFCAITVHQGRWVLSRSEKSVLTEIKEIVSHPKFKGVINDVGGPTANMYGFECTKKLKSGACDDKRCIFPETCLTLKPDHNPQRQLLNKIRKIPGVKHVFVASGIRHDLVESDKKNGQGYLEDIIRYHVSGQMKIAPEHSSNRVLKLMGKPSQESLERFKEKFLNISQKANKNQFLTYYFIAAHPGCSEEDMRALKKFASGKLGIFPEQVQIYTPSPSTWSSVMYYTGMNPFEKKGNSYAPVFVERDRAGKERQKAVLVEKRNKRVEPQRTQREEKIRRENKPRRSRRNRK